MNERKQKSIFIVLMTGIIICMLQGIWKNTELSVVAKECKEEMQEIISQDDTANSTQVQAIQKQQMPYENLMPSVGNVKALVFLVDFPNCKQTDNTINAEVVASELFDTENSQTLTSFYYTSSYEKLTITGDVYGYYTAQHEYSYYLQSGPEGRQALISELMENYTNVIDYSEYDSDNDGVIDALYIDYLGDSNAEWGDIDSTYTAYWMGDDVLFNGKKISQYVWLNRNVMNSVPNIQTVYKHETGHLLGLKDYYDDVEGTVEGSLGTFDMMCCNVGDHNAFSKILLGWIEEPLQIYDETDITLRSSQLFPEAAIIYPNNDKDSKQYFVVEYVTNDGNNENTDISTYIKKGGLRIWRVNAELTDDGKNYKYNNCNGKIHLLEAVGIANTSFWNQMEGNVRVFDTGQNIKANLYYENDELTPVSTPSSYIYESTDNYYGPFTTSGICVKNLSIHNEYAKASVSYDNEIKTDFNYEIEYSIDNYIMIELTFDYECTLLDKNKIYLTDGENQINITPELKYTVDYGMKKMYITGQIPSDYYSKEYYLTLEAGALINVYGCENSNIRETLNASPLLAPKKIGQNIVNHNMYGECYGSIVDLGNNTGAYIYTANGFFYVQFFEVQNENVIFDDKKELFSYNQNDNIVINSFEVGGKLIFYQYDYLLSTVHLYEIDKNGDYCEIYTKTYPMKPGIYALGNNCIIQQGWSGNATLLDMETYETKELEFQASYGESGEIYELFNNKYASVIENGNELGNIHIIDDAGQLLTTIDLYDLLSKDEIVETIFTEGNNIAIVAKSYSGTEGDTTIYYLNDTYNLISTKKIQTNSMAVYQNFQKCGEGYIGWELYQTDALRNYSSFSKGNGWCSQMLRMVCMNSDMQCITSKTFEDNDIKVTSIGNKIFYLQNEWLNETDYLTLYCQDYDTKSNDTNFSVLEQISLNKKVLTLDKGQHYWLKCNVKPNDVSCEIQWKSSNENVVKIAQNGKITAMEAGKAEVSVTSGEYTATCVVTVVEPEEGKYIYVTFDTNGGDQINEQKIVYYKERYGKLPTPTYDGYDFMGWFYYEGDMGIGVNEETEVTIKENHTLKALWQEKPKVLLNLNKSELYINETLQLEATVYPDYSNEVVWISSDETIASVDATGLVTAKTTGTAIITATSEEQKKSDSCIIVVKPKITPTSTPKITLVGDITNIPNETTPTVTTAPTEAAKSTIIPKPMITSVAEVTQNPQVTTMPTATQKPQTTAKPTVTPKPKATAKSTATPKPKAQVKAPAKPSIKTVKNVKGKKVIVKLKKKVKGAKGYQLTYATNSKFTKGKKTVNMKSTSKTISKLKKGKTYYVKVRAYTKDSKGKKVYGHYSNVKKVKIKK